MSFVPLNSASAAEPSRDGEAATHDQANNQAGTKF
jgi:hypothetical protein